MFNKIKQFFSRIQTAPAPAEKIIEGRRISLNRSFFYILVILLFIFGFWGGAVYGPDLWQQTALKYSQTLEKISDLLPWKTDVIDKNIPLSIDPSQLQTGSNPYQPLTNQEQAVMEVVKKASPAVVSIAIIKDLADIKPSFELDPFFEGLPFRIEVPDNSLPKGSTKRQVGGGTGFIISESGLLVTNRHVINDDKAEYLVVTNDNKRYSLKVLDKDPFQDLAICQIVTNNNEKFPVLKLGDSSNIQIGQTVVAIGNALGEYTNTVSVGVISGLGRTITAEGGGTAETLEDIIQTDAAINKGNSGGPLLNLKGEAIGINSAVAAEGQGIGFAIMINKAKRDIEQIQSQGKISYPFLGVRYVLITPDIQSEQGLSVDYGALVFKGSDREPAIVSGSAADKAGLKENDIILEADGQKITVGNSLSKIIQVKKPGDKVSLKVLRGDQEITLEATLGEKTSQE